MALTIQVVLLPAAGAVAAVLAFLAVFYVRPLATTFWLRKCALRMAGFRRAAIGTAVGTQAVWHGGQGPLLVLLHGAGDEAGTWSRVAPQLKRRFHVVMPDLAGHGASAPAAGVLSLGTLLSALEEVLDAPPWQNQSMVIAGNSLGAWVSMLYAHKNPHRVSRVILIDGGPLKSALEIGLQPRNRAEARRALDAIFDPSTPRRPDFVVDDLIRLSNQGPISRLYAAGAEDISRYLLDDQLASFEKPVDLIWGASDRLVPLDYAKGLQAQLPHSTLTVIARCGHGPQIERPRKLAQILLQILAADACPAPSGAESMARASGESR